MKFINYEFDLNGIFYSCRVEVLKGGCDISDVWASDEHGNVWQVEVSDDIQQAVDCAFMDEIQELQDDFRAEVKSQRTYAGKNYLLNN